MSTTSVSEVSLDVNILDDEVSESDVDLPTHKQIVEALALSIINDVITTAQDIADDNYPTDTSSEGFSVSPGTVSPPTGSTEHFSSCLTSQPIHPCREPLQTVQVTGWNYSGAPCADKHPQTFGAPDVHTKVTEVHRHDIHSVSSCRSLGELETNSEIINASPSESTEIASDPPEDEDLLGTARLATIYGQTVDESIEEETNQLTNELNELVAGIDEVQIATVDDERDESRLGGDLRVPLGADRRPDTDDEKRMTFKPSRSGVKITKEELARIIADLENSIPKNQVSSNKLNARNNLETADALEEPYARKNHSPLPTASDPTKIEHSKGLASGKERIQFATEDEESMQVTPTTIQCDNTSRENTQPLLTASSLAKTEQDEDLENEITCKQLAPEKVEELIRVLSGTTELNNTPTESPLVLSNGSVIQTEWSEDSANVDTKQSTPNNLERSIINPSITILINDTPRESTLLLLPTSDTFLDIECNKELLNEEEKKMAIDDLKYLTQVQLRTVQLSDGQQEHIQHEDTLQNQETTFPGKCDESGAPGNR